LSFIFFAALLCLAASVLVAQVPAPNEPSRQPAPAAPAAPVAAPAAQSAAAPAGVSAPAGYQLAPNDQVALEVFGEDDLRTVGRLNAEGNIGLPLLGSVHLAGLTLTQATARVTELYARDYLVSPKVNVSLIGYAKRRFTVLGQVNRPGSYEMPESSPGGIDLLEAIAMAGGYTRIAAPERVSVRRREQVMRVNAKQIERGSGGVSGNFRIESGDTITVGESIF
jgi:polysaccharide export outer membrane protein